MNKKLLFSLLLAGTAFTGHADEARLLRFPATNGSDIVFSYAGDLYKAPLNGGEAQKLTSHIGYEMFARFSPDGKSIAFTGQYDGNTEVYLIPTDGGEPQRLTYTATNSRDDLGDRMGPNNIVMTWTPDGKNIVYRNRISDGFDGKLWSISKNGGMSEVIPLPEGGFCSYSPDGKKLAYNRVMREFRNWVPAAWRSRAQTSIRAEFPSGNVPTTRVLRRISRFSRSITLLVRMRVQCSLGKS